MSIQQNYSKTTLSLSKEYLDLVDQSINTSHTSSPSGVLLEYMNEADDHSKTEYEMDFLLLDQSVSHKNDLVPKNTIGDKLEHRIKSTDFIIH